jgi:hypothetical protein
MDYIIDNFCRTLSIHFNIDIERIYLVWNQLNENYLNQLLRNDEELPGSYVIEENRCKFVYKNLHFCPNITLTEYCQKHTSRSLPSMPKIDEE